MTDAGLGTAPVRGVLFDYGLTLVTFERPDAALAAAYSRIERLLAGRRPAGDLDAAGLLHRVHDSIEGVIAAHEARGDLDEVDHLALAVTALRNAGYADATPALADEVLALEQRAWWEGIRLGPSALEVLRALRGMGLRIGLCSNAPYRAESFRGQLAHLGLMPLLDAVTLSSETGRRKPAPEIFAAALTALGTTAKETIMVGDRSREDISGAQEAGMRAIRVSEHHDDHGAGAEITPALTLNLLVSLKETLQSLVYN